MPFFLYTFVPNLKNEPEDIMATTRQPRKTTATRTVRQTDDYGHLQPQAPELEQAVLGALMIEKDAAVMAGQTRESTRIRRDNLN